MNATIDAPLVLTPSLRRGWGGELDASEATRVCVECDDVLDAWRWPDDSPRCDACRAESAADAYEHDGYDRAGDR